MPSSVWRINFNPDHLYFVTTSAVQRAKIFQRDMTKQILVSSLDYIRSNAWIKLFAFVIMPNHVHLIVQCQSEHPIQDIVRDFKKYTSKQIVAQYKAEGNAQALVFLRSSVTRPRKQTYAVWDDEYQAKDVFSPELLKQKMDYIHCNPLQPHWKLAEKPEEYVWSSARFYLCDKPCVITVDDARTLLT